MDAATIAGSLPPRHSLPRHRLPWHRLLRRRPIAGALLIALALLASRPGAVGAQGAEVVPPDRQGDFANLDWRGPRGLIRQRHWLVVDPDPAGLACRDATGRASIALRPGAIVESDGGTPPPLRLVQGRPWLRVKVPPVAILRDTRAGERGKPARCWVRANRTYLAPILPEALQAP